MHWTIFNLLVAGSALALPPRTETAAASVGGSGFAEVHRLPSHFDSVHVEPRTSDESHLTGNQRARRAAEAAKIQPQYPPERTSPQKIKTKFLWESGALIVFDATATAFSLTNPSQRSVLVGLIGGVSALAVGSAHLGDEGSSGTLARVTTTVGGVATGVAFWRALTPQSWQELTPMRRAANILSSVRTEPVVLPTGAIGRRVGWEVAFR